MLTGWEEQGVELLVNLNWGLLRKMEQMKLCEVVSGWVGVDSRDGDVEKGNA